MLQHSRKTYNNDQQECAVTLQNTLVWLGACHYIKKSPNILFADRKLQGFQSYVRKQFAEFFKHDLLFLQLLKQLYLRDAGGYKGVL